MTRTNDTNHQTIHFQTGRFVQQNGEWFYSTRENVERGPFISKEVAADDLDAYIYHRHNLESLGYSSWAVYYCNRLSDIRLDT